MRIASNAETQVKVERKRRSERLPNRNSALVRGRRLSYVTEPTRYKCESQCYITPCYTKNNLRKTCHHYVPLNRFEILKSKTRVAKT